MEIHTEERVYYIEEAKSILGADGTYHLKENEDGNFSFTPYLPKESSVFERKDILLGMLRELLFDEGIHEYEILTRTPQAMPFLRTLSPSRIVYVPTAGLGLKHPELEAELLEYTDSLYPESATVLPIRRELNPVVRAAPLT